MLGEMSMLGREYAAPLQRLSPNASSPSLCPPTRDLQQLLHVAQHRLRGPAQHRANGQVFQLALRCALRQLGLQPCGGGWGVHQS